ncbi:MAG: 2-amino-4-hydroxy-6-hydroxymethyldihydropteridine diphosphokinase [Actinomycetota bacterium]
MMYCVMVDNLELYGYHGVNPDEKKNGQPFVFDIGIEVADRDFANDDDIKNTVNYSEVVDLIKEVNSGRKYDLVETLAQVVAFRLLERFALAEKVNVSIKKIQPPIKEKLASVGVAYTGTRKDLGSSSCFLSLGSNTGKSISNLARAVKLVSGHRAATLGKVSSIYRTEPMHEKNQGDFFNLVLELNIAKEANPFEFLGFLKSIEYRLGRREYTKRYGPRPIDIDIVYWEGVKVSSPFLTIPHPRFAKRNFVLIPLGEIKPDFMVDGRDIASYIKEKNFKEKVEKLDLGLQPFDA